MLSFFGLRKDSKKSTSEKEVDGGFVVIGETVEEQRKKLSMNIAQPSTNVIVQPSKSSAPAQPCVMQPPASPSTQPLTEPSTAEGALILPDLLGDIPFTLAPHVLAMQAGFPFTPDVLLSQDINLAHFHYDFTLENSVLQNT